MKILHVIHSIDPRSGGPSHAIRSLVAQQIKSGHDVSLITTATQSAEPWVSKHEFIERMRCDAAFENVDLMIAPAYGRKRPWSRFAYSPAASRWLQKQFKDSQLAPEVVHIHGTFSHITHVAAKWSRKYAIPYIMRPAGSLNLNCFQMGSSALKRGFTTLYLERDMLGAACVQAMSRSEADEICAAISGCKITTIPHGVEYCQELESDGMLSDLQRGPQKLLFLSRIAEKKRPELILQAMVELRQDIPQLSFTIAGSDAGHIDVVKEHVERLNLGDSVTFAGFLQGGLKQKAFYETDLFVLPSLDENFGVAVVEAMAHGTPVLVTPGVASHVYVDESGCGLTVDDSVDAIANGIREILKQDRNELGRRGQEYVKKHLSWSAVCKQLDQMYAEAIAGKPQVAHSVAAMGSST